MTDATLQAMLWINAAVAWAAALILLRGGWLGLKRSNRMLRNASLVFLGSGIERAYVGLGFTLRALGILPGPLTAIVVLLPGLWVASVLLVALLVILHPWDGVGGAEPKAKAPEPPEVILAVLATESVIAAEAVEVKAGEAARVAIEVRASGSEGLAAVEASAAALVAKVAEAEELAGPPGPPQPSSEAE